MTYLVTGGAGFVGSHLVDALVSRGHSVTVLDNLSTGRIENLSHALDSGLVDFVGGSVLDADLVDDRVRSADACFHLASVVGVKLVVDRPLASLLDNVRGADIVISAAARHDRRLVFSSSSEIYGFGNREALGEDANRILGSPLKSRWTYANAKTFGEMLAQAYWEERGSRMSIARLFNTVGPRQRGVYGMVLPSFVRQALAGRDLTVYGDGTQSRCFLHVLDAVHALQLICDAETTVGQVFNVGSRTELSILALARRVIELTGSSSEIVLVPYAEAYGPGFEELGRRVPDASALEQAIGWRPTRSLDQAIEELISAERPGGSLRLERRVA